MIASSNLAPPFSWGYMNIHQGEYPSNIQCTDTNLTRFFTRYYLQKLVGVYKLNDKPKYWADNYLWACLYCYGYFGVVNTDIWGVIPQQCQLGGYTVQYQPYYYLIANPLIKNSGKPIVIGRDGALVKLTPNYMGVLDLVTYYANLSALTAQTLAGNIINSKLSYLFVVGNRNAAESVKKLYSEISSGNPAAVADKKLLGPDGAATWQLFNQNVGSNYIGTELLEALREIENQFATAIGLPNANVTKRERMVVDEVNANNVETQTMASLWLETMQEGFNQVNEMFGTNITVDWRFKPEEVKENETSINNTEKRSNL